MSLPTKSVYQYNFPSESGNKSFGAAPGKADNTKREPFKCWGCGEEHIMREFPYRKHNSRRVYNIQEAATINDVARRMPHIYVALDNKQDDHQDSVVEMEGMIANHIVSILIDLGYNLSYVSPQTIEKCKLKQVKHVKSWWVQQATGTKRKVIEVIPACQFIMTRSPTQETINMLPLGSYDLLIGREWLVSHRTKWIVTIKLWSVKMNKGER
jgi:hypothetical protein